MGDNKTNTLCLEVDFQDGGSNQMILLEEIDDCVYYGAFQYTFTLHDNAVAASFLDCPMVENSMMQVAIVTFFPIYIF